MNICIKYELDYNHLLIQGGLLQHSCKEVYLMFLENYALSRFQGIILNKFVLIYLGRIDTIDEFKYLIEMCIKYASITYDVIFTYLWTDVCKLNNHDKVKLFSRYIIEHIKSKYFGKIINDLNKYRRFYDLSQFIEEYIDIMISRNIGFHYFEFIGNLHYLSLETFIKLTNYIKKLGVNFIILSCRIDNPEIINYLINNCGVSKERILYYKSYE